MAEIHGIKGSGLASQLQRCIIVGAGESGAVLAFMELLPSPPGSDWLFDKQNSSAPGAWGEQSFESRARPPLPGCGFGVSFVACCVGVWDQFQLQLRLGAGRSAAQLPEELLSTPKPSSSVLPNPKGVFPPPVPAPALPQALPEIARERLACQDIAFGARL